MIVVNLYGGPGAGKSTGAAYVFARLKAAGVNVELVTEFAKDLVWDRSDALHDQVFVFAGQYHRLARLENSGVQVAVTDSPLLLSLIYAKNDVRLGQARASERVRLSASNAVRKLNSTFDNRDFVIRRAWPYVSAGRNETEDEAREIDRMVKRLGISPMTVDGTTVGCEMIVQYVLREMKEQMK